MQKRSWRFKLVVGGIILCMIPVSVITVFSAVEPVSGVSELTLKQPEQLVGTLARKVQLALGEEIRRIEVIGHERTVREAAALAGTAAGDAAVAAAGRYLAEVAGEPGSRYAALAILDSRGRFIAGREAAAPGHAPSRAFLKARSEKVGVGNPFRAEGSGETVVEICTPLFDQRGAFAGALSGMVRIGALISQIGNIRVGESGYAFLVDDAGRIIAHPGRELTLQPNQAGEELQRLAALMAARKVGTASYVDREEERFAAFAPVRAAGWSVGFTQTRKDLVAASRSTGYFGGALGGLVLLLALLTWAASLSKLPQPLERLLHALFGGGEAHPTPSRMA